MKTIFKTKYRIVKTATMRKISHDNPTIEMFYELQKKVNLFKGWRPIQCCWGRDDFAATRTLKNSLKKAPKTFVVVETFNF